MPGLTPFDGAAVAAIRPGGWYTVRQVAAICGRTDATVRRWLAAPGTLLVSRPKPTPAGPHPAERVVSGASLLAVLGGLAVAGGRVETETESETLRRATRAAADLK